MDDQPGGGSKFVKASEFKKKIGVSSWALRNWADSGKIESMRTPGGTRLYQLPVQQRAPPAPDEPRRGVLYARVSTTKQQDDLNRQIAYLRARHPEHLLITDTASGVNWKRRGLRALLDLAERRDISEVVVASRDRLCRFAFELIEYFLSMRDVKIVVLDSPEMSPEQELSDDLLSIVQIFCCRRNGRRRYRALNDGPHTKDKTEPEQLSEEEA